MSEADLRWALGYLVRAGGSIVENLGSVSPESKAGRFVAALAIAEITLAQPPAQTEDSK